MKEPSKEQIKERTKHLRQILKEKHEIDLPHGHALEVMAKVFGFNDWNTASALSSNHKSESRALSKIVADTKLSNEVRDIFLDDAKVYESNR